MAVMVAASTWGNTDRSETDAPAAGFCVRGGMKAVLFWPAAGGGDDAGGGGGGCICVCAFGSRLFRIDSCESRANKESSLCPCESSVADRDSTVGTAGAGAVEVLLSGMVSKISRWSEESGGEASTGEEGGVALRAVERGMKRPVRGSFGGRCLERPRPRLMQ